ncbi:MAG: DUF3267 domain-containing protein [Bacillota bacterium]
MIIIPGWLISLLTFPGVIVHEAAHFLFCRLLGVAVFDVCYFRVGNPAGYVIHEPTASFNKTFLISVGPFIVNSLLCILLCFPAFVPVRVFESKDAFSYLLIYLGVTIGMHAFPSTHDAQNLWRGAIAAAKGLNPLAVLSFPLVILIYIANALSFFWFDVFYGLGLGLGLPEIIFKRVF